LSVAERLTIQAEMAFLASLDERIAYFDYTEEDRRLLGDLGETLAMAADALVYSFYHHVLSYPKAARLIRDEDTKTRLLSLQKRYLLSLAGPVLDERYVAERRAIGETHNRIGLDPGWYLGSYSLYLALITPLVHTRYAKDRDRATRSLMALHKLLMFDASIAMDAYIEAREMALETANAALSRSSGQLSRDLESRAIELHRSEQRALAAEHLASMGSLVAGIAHEIGTPMGVIQGHAKLLESKVADEKSRWRLRTIQEQVARISKIIRSLLSMAKPPQLERHPTELPMVIDGTLSFVRERFDRHGIHVERKYADVPDVMADPERLQQVMLNLLVNAADAMQDGGILSIALQPAEGDRVEILVSDTGPGIPEDALARVFEPFFTTKGAGVGSGLGLSVARSIVEEHTGTIEVRSRAGGGTTFCIALPRA
jgi:signal transduction histidine kinase